MEGNCQRSLEATGRKTSITPTDTRTRPSNWPCYTLATPNSGGEVREVRRSGDSDQECQKAKSHRHICKRRPVSGITGAEEESTPINEAGQRGRMSGLLGLSLPPRLLLEVVRLFRVSDWWLMLLPRALLAVIERRVPLAGPLLGLLVTQRIRLGDGTEPTHPQKVEKLCSCLTP